MGHRPGAVGCSLSGIGLVEAADHGRRDTVPTDKHTAFPKAR